MPGVAKTNEEYMYVHNREELDQKVRYLVERGGIVQDQRDDEVIVFVKKKMNVVVLVVGLILCLVPGIAYLIWYLTADQNQLMHVKIGRAPNIGGYHPKEEYDTSGGASANAGPPPAGLPAQDGATQIPTMPQPSTDAAPVTPPSTATPPSTPPQAPPPAGNGAPESF